MSAISGRVNSTGGRWPLASMSRTAVPERKTRSSFVLLVVLSLAMAPDFLHQKVCSNFSGAMPISPGSNSSKIFWASYVP